MKEATIAFATITAVAGCHVPDEGVLTGEGKRSRDAAVDAVIDAPIDAPPYVPPCTGLCGTIVFVSARDGNNEIYSINANGTNLTRLTNNAAVDEDPVWSPDGQRIAFVSDRDGNKDLYVMNADGSNIVQRTFGAVGDINAAPSWSPDGTKLVYDHCPATAPRDLFIVGANVGGPSPALLYSNDGFAAGPSWSPTGKIAFSSDYYYYDGTEDIFVVNADGTGFAPVPAAGWHTSPQWSRTGGQLSATGYVDAGPSDWDSTLFVMNANGSNLTAIAADAQNWRNSSWSPDNLMIAYAGSHPGPADIKWVRADGSASGLIVANGWDPSWKP